MSKSLLPGTPCRPNVRCQVSSSSPWGRHFSCDVTEAKVAQGSRVHTLFLLCFSFFCFAHGLTVAHQDSHQLGLSLRWNDLVTTPMKKINIFFFKILRKHMHCFRCRSTYHLLPGKSRLAVKAVSFAVDQMCKFLWSLRCCMGTGLKRKLRISHNVLSSTRRHQAKVLSGLLYCQQMGFQM